MLAVAKCKSEATLQKNSWSATLFGLVSGFGFLHHYSYFLPSIYYPYIFNYYLSISLQLLPSISYHYPIFLTPIITQKPKSKPKPKPNKVAMFAYIVLVREHECIVPYTCIRWLFEFESIMK